MSTYKVDFFFYCRELVTGILYSNGIPTLHPTFRLPLKWLHKHDTIQWGARSWGRKFAKSVAIYYVRRQS